MTNPAEGYESYMVPALFGPWAALLIDAADPRRTNAFWTWVAEPASLLARLRRGLEPVARLPLSI